MDRALKLIDDAASERDLEVVCDTLSTGGIIVMPTDTVYGVGMAMSQDWGPDRIFEVKRRDPDKTIPLLVAGVAALDTYGSDIPAYAYRLARRFWPGALTVVVKAAPSVPPRYVADDGTIALRAPDHPFVLGLIDRLGVPLVVSSANLSGMPAPDSYTAVSPEIRDMVDLSIDGALTHVGVASSVVLCTGERPRTVRESAISAKAIEEASDEQD